MSGVLIALIVASASIGVAYVTARMSAKTQKALKEQDYARQDDRDAALIARQDKVAAELQAAQAETSRKTDAVAEAAEAARLALIANQALVARTTAETHEKLEVIRVDVNSNMTAAMQAELDATVRELAMMREVVSLKEAAGSGPSEDALVAIKATEERVNELQAKLKDRLQGTEAAAAAAAAAAADRVTADASAADV